MRTKYRQHSTSLPRALWCLSRGLSHTSVTGPNILIRHVVRGYTHKIQLVCRVVGNIWSATLISPFTPTNPTTSPLLIWLPVSFFDPHVGLKTHLLDNAVAHRNVDSFFVEVPSHLALVHVPRGLCQRQLGSAKRSGVRGLLCKNSERAHDFGEILRVVLCGRDRKVGNRTEVREAIIVSRPVSCHSVDCPSATRRLYRQTGPEY
jgi:hypothetical protein